MSDPKTSPDTIPFVDLGAQYARYKGELDAAIKEVLDATAFIGGPALQRFEEGFARWVGARHAIGVGNGTDALYLILRGMGIKAGDEVLVPANTFIATAEAVGMAGATPVFVDVDEKTATIDPAKAKAAITPRTKAIMPVHLYGQLADMDAIAKLGLPIVEDAAQAHGAERDGKRAGQYGVATGFSFYPGKNLGAYGDAGAVVTSDDALADKVRRIANHGRAEKYGHDMEGVNSRLDGLQAAILAVKLQHIDRWNDERRAAAKRYQAMLSEIRGVGVPQAVNEKGHVWHLFVIRVPDREGLKKHLASKNIQAGVHYPLPLHLQKAYAHRGLGKGSFPIAEKQAEEILSLPMFPEITEQQQLRVAKAVAEFMR